MGYAPSVFRHFPRSIASSDYLAVEVPHSLSDYDFFDTTGSGLLHWVLYRVRSNTDSHGIQPRIIMDGQYLYPRWTFYLMSQFKFDADSYPFQLLDYAENGMCEMLFYFQGGLDYHKSLKLSVYNYTARTQVIDCAYYITEFEI